MALSQYSKVVKSDLVALYTKLKNVQVKFGLTQTAVPDNSNSKIQESDISTLKSNASTISNNKYIKTHASLLNNWVVTKGTKVSSTLLSTISTNLDTIYNTCANDSVCSCNGYCPYDPCSSYESAVKSHQAHDGVQSVKSHNASDWSSNDVNKGPHCYSDASQCTAASCSGQWACGAKQNPVYTGYQGGCYGD